MFHNSGLLSTSIMGFPCLKSANTPTAASSVIALRFKSKSSRQKCPPQAGPRCSQEELKKTDCMKEEKKPVDLTTYKQKSPAECCKGFCVGAWPKFDDLYYVESDKLKRNYQKTWKSCGVLRTIPVPKCCHPKYDIPVRPKRRVECRVDVCPKEKCSPTICQEEEEDCKRINMPCCKKARMPPKCLRLGPRKPCRKRCTKYPAYSECNHPEPKKYRPIECTCLDRPSVCELFDAMRKLHNMKK